MGNRIKFAAFSLFSCGILIHLFFLGGVFDTYFTSPLISGLPSYRSHAKPMAKRLVLIVSDGLRAEGMFHYETDTPYLTQMRYSEGSWGVGHTQVPTESRPGHIGILAGIYEDPSAIFKGWQANTVEFDSVFKQCNKGFSWGCPDIVNIFEGNNVNISVYDDSDMKDFSGKQLPYKLDEWVFKHVTQEFTNRFGRECDQFCQHGNIFFLHLLGMDTAGHVFKPNSREYVDTLLQVDKGVKAMVKLIDGFFNDHGTAYIFTSDHGMTDRGSHGSGSEHETEIPVIAWGAGFAKNSKRVDMNQTDLAPLIASVLGINIPVNSIGRLPVDYLDGAPEQKAGALLANVKQIAEQYFSKSNDTASNIFNIGSMILSSDDLTTKIRDLENYYATKQYDRILKESGEVIELSLRGIRYYQRFHEIPRLVCLLIIFVCWFVFVSIFICNEYTSKVFRRRFRLYRKILKPIYYALSFVVLVMLAMNVAYQYYVYFAVGVGVFYLLNRQLMLNENHLHLPVKIYEGALMIVYIELLMLSFFNRAILAIGLCVIGSWTCFTFQNIPKELTVRWVFSLSLVGMFLFVEPISPSFSYTFFFLTISSFYFVCVTTLGSREATSGIYLFTTCSAHALAIAMMFDTGYGVGTGMHIMSYAYVICAICTVRRCSSMLMSRFKAIVIALMAVYIQTTIALEGLFYCALVTLMFTWMEMELYNGTLIEPPSASWRLLHVLYYHDLPNQRRAATIDDFRRVLYYITFVLLCFFGTGNIASVSSFDPMAARAFASNFLPFLIMVVLIIKICIPFILCTCAFVMVVSFSKSNVTKMLAIIMLVCDVMVLNFTFLIKNEGSWKQIGMSLSHFVIAEAMTVVLIILYYACWKVLSLTGADVDPKNRKKYWDDIGTPRFRYANFFRYYNAYVRREAPEHEHRA